MQGFIGSALYYAYPYTLVNDWETEYLITKGPYLWWTVTSIWLQAANFLPFFFQRLWLFSGASRGYSNQSNFVSLVKFQSLSYLVFTPILMALIYTRYNDYNYLITDDENFNIYFGLLGGSWLLGLYNYNKSMDPIVADYMLAYFENNGYCVTDNIVEECPVPEAPIQEEVVLPPCERDPNGWECLCEVDPETCD